MTSVRVAVKSVSGFSAVNAASANSASGDELDGGRMEKGLEAKAARHDRGIDRDICCEATRMMGVVAALPTTLTSCRTSDESSARRAEESRTHTVGVRFELDEICVSELSG